MQGQANRTLIREEKNEDGFQLSLSNEDFRPQVSLILGSYSVAKPLFSSSDRRFAAQKLCGLMADI